jgi:urea carboxylase
MQRVLIADRGVVAVWLQRALRSLGLHSIQIHSAAERYAEFVLSADQAVCVGPRAAADSYLNASSILDAARTTRADAVHSGGSALADNPNFSQAVAAAGKKLLGPPADSLRRLQDPLFLSNTSGLLIWDPARVAPAERTRHIDVPVLGNGKEVRALASRDSSARFGGRVLLAEAPAPNLADDARKMMLSAATAIARSLSLVGLFTIEFALSGGQREPEIIGAHARLGSALLATEAISGLDLLALLLRLDAGEPVELPEEFPALHALLANVERDPDDAGVLSSLELPDDAAAHTWALPGTDVIADYDPQLFSLVASGPTRDEAHARLARALGSTRVGGLYSNLSLLSAVLDDPVERAGELTPTYTQSVRSEPVAIEVLAPGAFTILVDYPGRVGYWHVGIPPSGAADPLSFRLANRIVGNPDDAAGLELTLSGPSLRFTADAVIALTGAPLPATLDGEPLLPYRPLRVRAGQTLEIKSSDEPGCRAYLAVRGGLDAPVYLGSRTTFTLGGFGGHRGRTLRRGDKLLVGGTPAVTEARALPPALSPVLSRGWSIGVLLGPHAAPDFFTPRDIEVLFRTAWEVHFQSSRTGIRLIGPKPEWARQDGGEAGLHPSNIHDVPYAIGAIDFTGDMPILLGPDGPSLGGFVCPATVAHAELWKLGQLRPGDRVRFVLLTEARASELAHSQETLIARLDAPKSSVRLDPAENSALLRQQRAVIDESPSREPAVVYRRSGDRNLLVEYGPPVLDLSLRFRVHALMTWLQARREPGILELTPGIRSLQIHFDPAAISAARLLDLLKGAENELPRNDELEVPTRVVHLPLSWDDPETRRAIAKYMQSVRPDAPWCPSNLEFIRRINGLDSIRDVHDIVFNANYLVLGLGDVYLGAPVATPVDPRHRLVTTKYNPARTWTPENAVGIGGAYLCVYGMEGPGGYQFVGRTVQMYNPFKPTREFERGTPWLLRFFDQIRFYSVSAGELLELREAFPYGKAGLRIEPGTFRLADVDRLLTDQRPSIERFKARQQGAFDAERRRWIESGQLSERRAHGSRPWNAQPGAV